MSRRPPTHAGSVSAATRLALALAWAAVSFPRVAEACAVCAGGNPANRFAFFASTMALSALPLGLFVGAFLWLRARIRKVSADEFTERDSAPAANPAAPLPAPPTPAPHTG